MTMIQVTCLSKGNKKWKYGKTYQDLKAIKQVAYGRIRTYNKVTYTSKHGVRHWKDRILKYKKQSDPYRTGYRVTLWQDRKPHDMLVCRLVATTFLEDLINTEMTVNHKDGNRLNNNIENLEWLTKAENIRHGFKNNLYTTQKNCMLINTKNNKKYYFNSLSKASLFIGRGVSYISSNMRLGAKIKSKEGIEYKVVIL